MKKLKLIPLPVLLFVVSLIAIFFQGTVLPLFLPVIFIPDFIIFSVLALSVTRPNVYGVLLSFFCGFIFDLSQGLLIGPWAGAYTILFVCLVVVSRQIFFSKGLILFIVASLSTLLTNLIYLSIASFVPVSGQLVNSFQLVDYSIIFLLLLKVFCTGFFSIFCMNYLCRLYVSKDISRL